MRYSLSFQIFELMAKQLHNIRKENVGCGVCLGKYFNVLTLEKSESFYGTWSLELFVKKKESKARLEHCIKLIEDFYFIIFNKSAKKNVATDHLNRLYHLNSEKERVGHVFPKEKRYMIKGKVH